MKQHSLPSATFSCSIPKELRYTRNQFDREFPNDDVCLETVKADALAVWPDLLRNVREGTQALPREGAHGIRL